MDFQQGDEVIVAAEVLRFEPLSPKTGVITKVFGDHKHVITTNPDYTCHSLMYPYDRDLTWVSKKFRIGEKVVIVGGKSQELCRLKGQSMEVVPHSGGEHPVVLNNKAGLQVINLQLQPPQGRAVVVPARLVQSESQYYEEALNSLAGVFAKIAVTEKQQDQKETVQQAVQLEAGKGQAENGDGPPGAVMAKFRADVSASQQVAEACLKQNLESQIGGELEAAMAGARQLAADVLQPVQEPDSDDMDTFDDDYCGFATLFDFITKGIKDMVIGSITFRVIIERPSSSVWSNVAVSAAVLAVARVAGLLSVMTEGKHGWLLDVRMAGGSSEIESFAKHIFDRILMAARPKLPRTTWADASTQAPDDVKSLAAKKGWHNPEHKGRRARSASQITPTKESPFMKRAHSAPRSPTVAD